MSGGAKDAQSRREGIYKLSLDLVNGKSHWMHEGGSHALWFEKTIGNWIIGTKDNIGSTIRGLESNVTEEEPQDATIWKYYKDKKWIESNDTKVFAGNDR